MVGRVLIIDGLAANRLGMKARLAAAAYDPIVAADGNAALVLARATPPDAVLVDLDIGGPSGGVEVVRRLRTDHHLGQTPLIGLGAANDPSRRIAALDAGADDVLARPVEDAALFARLRNLMRRPEPLGDLTPAIGLDGLAEAASPFVRPGLVAVVSDRADVALRLRTELSPLMAHRCITRSRSAALADAGAHIPDVFLLDGDPDGAAGTLSLMADLRSRGSARHASFCLLRPSGAAGMDALAYDMGAQDVSPQGGDLRELALRLGAVMRRKQRVDLHRAQVQAQLRLAVRDPLTGLYNRRYALAQLAGVAEAARMEGYAYAVMVLDLDRFKAINDQHGHAAGDAVLIAVGERLLSCVRAADLVSRHGGEEFLIVLPHSDAETAAAVARRLCATVAANPFALPGGGIAPVTASIGLALGRGEQPARGVVDRADRALLSAKQAGRNRVMLDADVT